MKRMTLFTFAVFVTVSTAATAQTVSRTYSYFSIGGETLDEIDKELSARGPKVQSTGRRHPGATEMQFSTRLTFASTSDWCRIEKAVVAVSAKIILPKWGQRKRADSDTRLIWDTLASDIKRHEESHVQIAKTHARKIEDALGSLGSRKDCETLKKESSAVSRRMLDEHDRAQDRFDRVESINFDSRLTRLLTYRLKRIEAAKAKKD